ncbi:MAG: sel1 repeat family protein [Algicola sp.]|nr:sel1 repeat family protein [Algicola sp.]
MFRIITVILFTLGFSAYSNDIDVAQYTKAAEQGQSWAQYNLGVMHEQGKGVVQDYKKAVHWFTQSAEQGYLLAQFNLGFMFVGKKGIAVDYSKAYIWWFIAAKNGHKKSLKNRDIIAKQLSPTELEAAQAAASKLYDKINSK